MDKVGGLLNWFGGSIGRAAGTGLIIGLFMVVFGMTPAQAVAYLIETPPNWLLSGWTRLIGLIVGIAVIWASLNYNRWSRKQQAIDLLAEDISWAIHDLVNRNPRPSTEGEIDKFDTDYRAWCDKVSSKLNNRAFFTRADQLHFDRLGFVPPLQMSGHARLDWLLGQLRLKFERLRDVINWTQQRRMS
jgi:hypothetical protein